MTSTSAEKRDIRIGVMHQSFGQNLRWIDDFVPAGNRFVFHKITPPYTEEISWHSRGKVTTAKEWLGKFRYALKAARRDDDVVVTNFPQLAFAICFWKRVLRKRFKIVAWSFNIGSVSSKKKGRIAGFLLRSADLMIVHSREEIERYSAWLGLPKDRFMFVPLQQGEIRPEPDDAVVQPFVVSLGSAGRDYRTLFAAVSGRPERMVVVAKPEAVAGLDIPQNVELLNGLSLVECQNLAAKAALGVVPVSNLDTASGQVTFLMLMALGVPLIVTDCPGSRDYIRDGHDAIMVPPHDADALRDALERVWSDQDLRSQLAENGLQTWRERFSDEAAGVHLVRTLNHVLGMPTTADHPL